MSADKSEAELRRERIMARGTDRLKRLEQARLSESGGDASVPSNASQPPAEVPAAPIKVAEHFPAPKPAPAPRQRAQPPVDAFDPASMFGSALANPPSAPSGQQQMPNDPMDIFAQIMGQMGQMGGPPGPDGAPAGMPDPTQLLAQMAGGSSNPLLGAMTKLMKPADPRAAALAADLELEKRQALRLARPFRIVGMLCAFLIALFSLYLLATSQSVVDFGGVDEDGDQQVGEYAGWRSGVQRIARLRLGNNEVLDDLGREATGYPIWLILLASFTTLQVLRLSTLSLFTSVIDSPRRPPVPLAQHLALPMRMAMDDFAVFVFTIGVCVSLASLAAWF